MANITMTAGSLHDLISEEIACKVGLLVATHQVHDLLRRDPESDSADVDLFELSPDSYVRIRPEEVDHVIDRIRFRLGNLADTRHPIAKRVLWTRSLEKEGIAVAPIYDAFKKVMETNTSKVIGLETAEAMAIQSGIPLIYNIQFLQTIGEQFDRQVNWFSAEEQDVEWAIPLRDLFETENIPKDPESYFDQRFIDYLVQNGEDLQTMHWRNFERLSAEFFARYGYEIELGKGSKDGGIDLRIWSEGSNQQGPPLIMVQCKRYKEGHDVGVESVKAFWSDVKYGNAQHGIIATTSRVSPEGIKISRARKWPLGFIQQQQVSHWVKTMWRHAPLEP